ncbi:uncharacterized mitochondrial protein-like protein [Tanacetum coccineum]
MVPRAVLMKSGLVSINTARQNISKIAVSVNTARQVNTAHSKTTVNAARPMSYLSKIAHSTVKRPIHKNITFKNSNINQRVNTVRGKKFNTARPKAVVNAVKGNNFNVVKASACWRNESFCEMKGILRQFSIARTPQQNGVAEKENRTLIEAARTMLADSKLPATFCVNRKFDGKADEGFFIGYSLNSKAFRVFNSRTRIVEENLHIRFSESTPNVVGSGPDWLFDIDALTRIIDYEPIVADPKSSHDDGSKPSSDDGKKVDEDPRKESECNDQEKEDNVNSTNNVNAAGINEVNVVGGKTSIEPLFDPNMPVLKDYSIFDFSRDNEDDGVEANMNNLDTTIQKFGFTEVKTASTPMETQKPLLKDEDGEEVDVHMYKYPKDSPFDLVEYTDSDYARACLDRKSTTGCCQFLRCRLISWHSKAKKSVKLMMEKLLRMELELMLVKTINEEAQLHALVDGKKIIVTESSVRRDLQLADEEGVECLLNSTIFEQLALMGPKTTAWNEFSSTMASAIIYLATN